tara:strand:+ start:222 stop:428 length:207 start_codon:yes stop_codon:yes gene_type:complete
MVMQRQWKVQVYVNGVFLVTDSFDTERYANEFADDAIKVLSQGGKRDVEVMIFNNDQIWSSYNTANNA